MGLRGVLLWVCLAALGSARVVQTQSDEVGARAQMQTLWPLLTKGTAFQVKPLRRARAKPGSAGKLPVRSAGLLHRPVDSLVAAAVQGAQPDSARLAGAVDASVSATLEGLLAEAAGPGGVASAVDRLGRLDAAFLPEIAASVAARGPASGGLEEELLAELLERATRRLAAAEAQLAALRADRFAEEELARWVHAREVDPAFLYVLGRARELEPEDEELDALHARLQQELARQALSEASSSRPSARKRHAALRMAADGDGSRDSSPLAALKGLFKKDTAVAVSSTEAAESSDEDKMTIEKVASFGVAGVLSIAVAESVFWLLSFPISEALYYAGTGEFVDLMTQEGQVKYLAFTAGWGALGGAIAQYRTVLTAAALTPWMDREVVKPYVQPLLDRFGKGDGDGDGDAPSRGGEPRMALASAAALPEVDSGVAAATSYALWEGAFWGVTLPHALAAYHQVTGHWPDMSNPSDLASVRTETSALVDAVRFALPLRVGLALGTTPWVQANLVDKIAGRQGKQ